MNDLNSDQYTDTQEEFKQCVGTPEGVLCPVSAVNCVAGLTDPSCLTGGTFNAATNKCEAAVISSYVCSLTGQSYTDSTSCGNNCSQQVTQYTCPLSGSTYSDQTTCNNACIQTANCTQSSSYYQNIVYAFGSDPLHCRLNYSMCYNNVCNAGDTCVAGGELLPTEDWFNCDGSFADCRHDFYTCPISGGSACSGSPQTCNKSASCTGGTSTQTGSCASGSSCPSGYTLSGGVCISSPVCASGTFDSSSGKCVGDSNICPLGSQYTCMDYNGTKMCSKGVCGDITKTENKETTEVNSDMLQDDGPKDADENCLGQIFLFTGRAMTCHPSGYDNSWKNCCDEDMGQTAMAEGVGSASTMVSVVNGVRTMYQMGQVAYFSNAVASGASTIANVGGTYTVYTGTAATGYATTAVTPAVGEAVAGVQAAGVAGEAAITTGLTNYISAMINPTTIAIAVVLYIVTSLLSKGCNQQDIETSMLNKSKMCHYAGEYCQTKYFFGGCSQKAKAYCCFNSKLARIIHEQGRPMLKTFQSQQGGIWGDAKSPKCRGLTPEEFQGLDFSQMDLSEYFEDIKTKATATVQQNVGDKVQKYYDNIKK